MKKNIKKILEKIMYCLFATKTDKIYKKIEKYDYVSFDIFDTLIKRKTSEPEDVFDIVEKKSNIQNFKKKRIEAQKKALLNTDREEITIKEIYQNFESVTKEERERLIQLEFDTEKKVCKQNIDIFKLYKYCIEKNKNIYIISDMYLPLNIIEEILKENNYIKYDKILLSSDIMYTKKSGNIFKNALDDNIRKNIIHIGDHPLSDYINPRRCGMKSILITKKKEKKNAR